MAEEAPTEVNDLSPACFVAVFSILGAAETARAMCVHPLWAEHLRDDILWRPNLLEVYARAEATLPDGAAAQSFRWGDVVHGSMLLCAYSCQGQSFGTWLRVPVQ